MSDQPEPLAFYAADSLATEIYDARAAEEVPASSMAGDVDFY